MHAFLLSSTLALPFPPSTRRLLFACRGVVHIPYLLSFILYCDCVSEHAGL